MKPAAHAGPLGTILHRLLWVPTYFTVVCFALGATAAPPPPPCSGIAGVVTDPSGAVVAGARVTVQADEAGQEKICVTGEDGSYNFPALSPGRYSIRVEARGFKPSAPAAALVDGSSEIRVDVQLSLRSESTIVEISA